MQKTAYEMRISDWSSDVCSSDLPIAAFGLGGFAAGAALRQVVLATRRQGVRGFLGRTNGGMIVHLGVIVIAVAIAANGSYLHESEARYSPGETRTVAGHEIRSEEHTYELQSLMRTSYAVFCLKKKKKQDN